MVNAVHSLAWRVIGASVRGAAHLRKNLPNQDAIAYWPETGVGLPLIVAVSDGHGSAKSFRSQQGANFAVKTALAVMQDVLSHDQGANLTTIKRLAAEQLPKQLVRQWQTMVVEDVRRAPFSEDEITALTGSDPTVAYGATLVILVLTAAFMLYMQLGDGDILTVWPAGQVERPLPNDDRLFANETTSLCRQDAWKDFRARLQPLSRMPELVLLATDGYANSFRDEANFLQVGTDLRQLLQAEGADYIAQNLEIWLQEASQAGSGDDITVGLLYSDARFASDDNEYAGE